MSAMAMPPVKQAQPYSWAIYHLKGTPAKPVGFAEAPDEQTNTARAIEDTTCR